MRNFSVHKLNQKRLNQMIENAISFRQENSTVVYIPWFSSYKNLFSKPKTFCITVFSFFLLAILLLPTSRSLYSSDAEEIYDLVMLEIINDF